jgi:flagellar protein FlaG
MDSIKGFSPPSADFRPKEAEVPPSIGKTKEPNPASEQGQGGTEQVLEFIKDEMNVGDINLDISVDQSTGTILVKVVDGETGKVIREIPAPELVALARRMEELTGVLINDKI